MKRTCVETARSLLAFFVSIIVFGFVVFSGPAFFALWYWFLQGATLLVVGLILRITFDRVVPHPVIDAAVLTLSAAAAIGITYSTASGDGRDAAVGAAQLAAFCTLPAAVIAFAAIVLSRRYIPWPDLEERHRVGTSSRHMRQAG